MKLSKREHEFFTELEQLFGEYDAYIQADRRFVPLTTVFIENGKLKRIDFINASDFIIFTDDNTKLSEVEVSDE